MQIHVVRLLFVTWREGFGGERLVQKDLKKKACIALWDFFDHNTTGHEELQYNLKTQHLMVGHTTC
jgi:hypothetical protein